MGTDLTSTIINVKSKSNPLSPSSVGQRKRSNSVDFNFQHAVEKLGMLKNLGYKLVGDLPDSDCRVTVERMNKTPAMKFLLIKDGLYYVSNSSDLVNDSNFINADQDVNSMVKLAENHNFIYVIIQYKDKLILRMREDVSLSGHKIIVGPYFSHQENVEVKAAGELYFMNSHLALITPKSGCFPMNEEECNSKAVPVLKSIFGKEGIQKFKHIVTSQEVDFELRQIREKNITNTRGTSNKDIKRPNFFKDTNQQVENIQFKPQNCCIIL